MEEPRKCVLRLQVGAGVAKVLNEDGCAGYHGAAASFVEQGRKLVRD